MNTRQVALMLALASSMGLLGCTKDQADPPPVKDSAATVDTADAAVAKCISNKDDLIADFASDNGLWDADGRSGGFYLYGDNSIKGLFDPPLVKDQPYPIDTGTGNDECSGPGSFHTKASGWGVWGAALGTDFKPKDSSTGLKGTYDASKYKGISFWAKSAAPLSRVQVGFKDMYTDGDASFAGFDDADAGISQCVYAPDPKSNCSPYVIKFGDSQFPLYQDIKIDTSWKRFDVLFADSQQDQYNVGFHTVENKLDTKHMTGMSIQVNADFSTSPPTPNDFEIWIDDVNFIK